MYEPGEEKEEKTTGKISACSVYRGDVGTGTARIVLIVSCIWCFYFHDKISCQPRHMRQQWQGARRPGRKTVWMPQSWRLVCRADTGEMYSVCGSTGRHFRKRRGDQGGDNSGKGRDEPCAGAPGGGDRAGKGNQKMEEVHQIG